MKLNLSFKRFLSLSPSSSSELHHLASSSSSSPHPPPSPSSLLPLAFPSSFHPLPTSSSATPKSPLAFPATFFTPTPNNLQNSESSSSSHGPSHPSSHSSSSSHQHHSSPTPTPTPTPNSNTPQQPQALSDALWQSQFSLSLAHLHTTLPHFFPPNPSPHFPPEIYHPNITLSLPIPLGGLEEMHGLTVYGLVFGGARRSLSLLLADMWVRVERCTILPPGGSGEEAEGEPEGGAAVEGLGGEFGEETGGGLVGGAKKEGSFGSINKARMDRKVRLRVKVGGRLRIPSLEGGLLGGGEGVEREWTISNLYTFSPLTALITHHQVETIHPAPGEGLSGWVTSWRGGGGGGGGKRAVVAEEGQGQGCASAKKVDIGRKGVC